MESTSYLQHLNPAQRDAVTTTQGPVLVLAGAGSGKTRVLTYRIAHLLKQGVSPWRILALTFTNKAAGEMKERIAKLVSPEQASQLWMGTFHSIFLRILRTEAEHIGFTSTFSVYDTAASRTILSRIVKEKQLPPEQYKPQLMLGRISMAKNSLITPDRYLSMPEFFQRDSATKTPAMGEIYDAYCTYLRRANALDFDDLLVKMSQLLTLNDSVREKYQTKFSHILVDEYQDTNAVQNRILHLLAAGHRNLCVVGDDAQSIYAFRGARIQNILQFPKIYPDLKQVHLTTNYRSTESIVSAANRLIAQNANQIPKECVAHQKLGAKVRIESCYTDMEEAFTVAKEIQQTSHAQQATYDQFAVLYRTNAQSRQLEVALRKFNIPYRVYGGTSFYQRKVIQDLLAYFRLVNNPTDEEAFLRIVNYPTRGIGSTSIAVLLECARANSLVLWEVVERIEELRLLLRPQAITALLKFREMIRSFISDNQTVAALTLAIRIYAESGLKATLEADKSIDGEGNLEHVTALFTSIEEFVDNEMETGSSEFVTLPMFLDNVTLMTDTDLADKAQGQMVTLTTVHSAKGLEFDYVYVVGLEENLFPSARAQYEANGIEEERRLCYVAITRAAKELVLTYACTRAQYGSPQNNLPSRFLSEIDSDYLEKSSQPADHAVRSVGKLSTPRMQSNYAPRTPSAVHSPARRKPSSAPPIQHEIAPQNVAKPEELRVGDAVLHSRFGEGKIRHLQGEGFDMRVIVDFNVMGERTLLLKFARLQKL